MSKLLKVLGLFALSLMVLGAVMSTIITKRPKSPAEIDAERKAAVLKAKQDAAFDRVHRAALALRKSLRDPESLKFDAILATEDASVICFQYRAKNGFGGYVRENIVLVGSEPSTELTTLQKYCQADNLHDFGAVAAAL